MKKNFVILIAVLMACLFRFYTALQGDLHLSGFSPLMALAFVGGSLWSGSRFLAAFTMGCLILTDLALNVIHGYPGYHHFMLVTTICYFAVFTLGSRLQNSPGTLQFKGLIGSSLLFYMITNTVTWFGSAFYPQTMAGWIQSWTWGLPGYPPTFTFLRNALLSDMIFWGILKVSLFYLSERSPENTEALSAS